MTSTHWTNEKKIRIVGEIETQSCHKTQLYVFQTKKKKHNKVFDKMEIGNLLDKDFKNKSYRWSLS